MIVSELIEHLKTLQQDLPVYLTTSDDPEHCYREIKQSDITTEEVCTWEEQEEQNHFQGVVVGHGVYFP